MNAHGLIDAFPASKEVENENDDEDDWDGTYIALITYVLSGRLVLAERQNTRGTRMLQCSATFARLWTKRLRTSPF